MKSIAKKMVVGVLRWQLGRLRRKHKITVIAVAGSVGKTSTKLTIAGVLRAYCRVQVQEGNYNDIVTVPLIFFGRQNPPRIINPIAWLKIIFQNEIMLLGDYPYDVVIVELGTDGPGQMQHFKKLLQADIGVLTSIGHEHMEFFNTLDAVAAEELIVQELSNNLIVSHDDIPDKYRKKLTGAVTTYGNEKSAHIVVRSNEQEVEVISPRGNLTFRSQIIGSHLHKTFGAAVAVCSLLDITMDEKLRAACESIMPVAGRMQPLTGKNNSIIIDDTYNNVSSEPAIAALKVLYEQPRKKKIAILGNMNELGKFSDEMHRSVGEFCDPHKLAEVITIGPDANKILAETARKKGNKVSSFDSPYKIAIYLEDKLDKQTVLLFKGSQNRVYLEEAIKPLLKNQGDASRLVRQTPAWIANKQAQFK